MISKIVLLLIFVGTVAYCKPKTVSLADPPMGGYFELDSIDGRVSVNQWEGKLILLYFGFLSCPDVCPNTMVSYSQVFKTMPEEKRNKIQFLFVGVDFERDKVDSLEKYVKAFHPSFVGLTGDEDSLKNLAQSYGASFQKVPIESAMGYTLDHSTRVFVLNSQGELMGSISHGTSREDIQKELDIFLSKL
jgi:protein SCO1